MRQLFKGDNYSREETINYYDFLSATTIQGRQLFKGGNYSWKYGMLFVDAVTRFWGPGKTVYLETALSKIHSKSLKSARFAHFEVAYLEALYIANPSFFTGIPAMRTGFSVMKTGVSL